MNPGSPALLALALASAAAHRPSAAEIVHRLSAEPAQLAGGAKARSMKAVAAANRKALVEPDPSGFINAAQIYPWSEGAIYRLFTAPGLVSDVALQPAETLVSVAAGDTTRWVIGDTTSGAAPGKRTHILVKPIAAGLRTNLVITTDRRVYLVALESRSGEGMAAISWTYPRDALIALKAAAAAALPAASVAEGIAVERLNFNYRIEGDRPPWTPVRAFDDGTQTFIEFPPSIGTGEIPPLFVIGSSGRAELINYRQSGRYYVVDRLFSVAELRLGEKHQQVVRILRADARRRGSRP
jgi:type IV secretion system protein VirB9